MTKKIINNNNHIKNKQLHLSPIQIMPSALSFFSKELVEAGGFDELMISKRALERIDGHSYIVSCQNIDGYKEEYLAGKYRPLRPYFNTKIPYAFWTQLYVALKKNMHPSK
jgi:hypothetical protein